MLPSDFNELELYVKSHKKDLTEMVVSSIEFALEKDLPVIEVFNFKNSDFVITIPEKDFLNNIKNVYDFYLKEELYELCGRVGKLKNLLDNKKLHHNEKTQ